MAFSRTTAMVSALTHVVVGSKSSTPFSWNIRGEVETSGSGVGRILTESTMSSKQTPFNETMNYAEMYGWPELRLSTAACSPEKEMLNEMSNGGLVELDTQNLDDARDGIIIDNYSAQASEIGSLGSTSGKEDSNLQFCSAELNKLSDKKLVKKRSVRVEKQISISDVQPLLSKKLVDAAKTLGVSRSTLKRRWKEFDIGPWPSSRTKKPHSGNKHIHDAKGKGLAGAGLVAQEDKISNTFSVKAT